MQSPEGGRKPIDIRTVFTSLVYFLITAIGWRDLPTEIGANQCTVQWRLKAWSEADLCDAITERLLAKMRAAGRLDVAEVLIDGGSTKNRAEAKNRDRIRQTPIVAAAN